MKYNKDMLLGDALKLSPKAAPIFMGFGMHCLGCPASQMESIEEAAMVHGINLDELLEKLEKEA